LSKTRSKAPHWVKIVIKYAFL
jgi:hypothetical protein